MADTISVSVKDDDQEILEWIERKKDRGEFSSTSHAFVYAVKRLKNDETDTIDV